MPRRIGPPRPTVAGPSLVVSLINGIMTRALFFFWLWALGWDGKKMIQSSEKEDDQDRLHEITNIQLNDMDTKYIGSS